MTKCTDNYDYFFLKQIYENAVAQAQSGKGKERHATEGEAFERQQICEIARRLGDNSGPLYQAVKKIYESKRLNPRHAIHELLGALNYVATAVLLLEEQVIKEMKEDEEKADGDAVISTRYEGI